MQKIVLFLAILLKFKYTLKSLFLKNYLKANTKYFLLTLLKLC